VGGRGGEAETEDSEGAVAAGVDSAELDVSERLERGAVRDAAAAEGADEPVITITTPQTAGITGTAKRL
jgi:hypothetical protein